MKSTQEIIEFIDKVIKTCEEDVKILDGFGPAADSTPYKIKIMAYRHVLRFIKEEK